MLHIKLQGSRSSGSGVEDILDLPYMVIAATMVM